MKRLIPLFLLLLLLTCLKASALVTATITVTNVPNFGSNYTVNGASRMATNALTSTTFVTNLISTGASTTNIFNQINAYPFGGLIHTMTASNVFTLKGTNVIVTVPGAWAFVTYATNSQPTTHTIDAPPNAVIGLPVRTNNASAIIDYLNRYAATNSIEEASQATTNFVALVKAQTFGNKVITNSSATNWTATGVRISSATFSATNSYCSNCIGYGWISTNGANYGNAFRSPGDGANSDQFGSGALATNTQALAVGYNSIAAGQTSLAIGAQSWAQGDRGTAIGSAATAGGDAVAIGQNSDAATNAIAIGSSASAAEGGTAIGLNAIATNGQFVLGTSSQRIDVPGVLAAASSTNNLFLGTNILTGSIAFTPRAIATLVNGNNAGVELGTNTLVQLSGATTYCELAGFVAKESGRIYEVEISGAATNYVINYTGSSRSTDGTAARRIETGTGGDLTLTNNPAFIRIYYNTTVSRWRVMSFSR